MGRLPFEFAIEVEEAEVEAVVGAGIVRCCESGGERMAVLVRWVCGVVVVVVSGEEVEEEREGEDMRLSRLELDMAGAYELYGCHAHAVVEV